MQSFSVVFEKTKEEESIGGILLERGASFEDENFTPRVLGVDYGIGSLDNYIDPRKSSLLGSFSSRFSLIFIRNIDPLKLVKYKMCSFTLRYFLFVVKIYGLEKGTASYSSSKCFYFYIINY